MCDNNLKSKSISHTAAICTGLVFLLAGGVVGYMLGMKNTMDMVEDDLYKPSLVKKNIDWQLESKDIEIDMLKRQIKVLLNDSDTEKAFADLSKPQRRSMLSHRQALIKAAELVPEHGVITEWRHNGDTITLVFADKSKMVFSAENLLRESEDQRIKVLLKLYEALPNALLQNMSKEHLNGLDELVQ